MTAAISFMILASVLLVAGVLALVGIIHLALSGSDAIERDGLFPGTLAPPWTLRDASGAMHQCPPSAPLQLIIFTDHSLKSFPSVVKGLRDLRSSEQLEVVIILRRFDRVAEQVLAILGLGEIPILLGSPRLYALYNVRVTPWLIFIDADRTVRASSLVNHDWQVDKLYRLARVQLASKR